MANNANAAAIAGGMFLTLCQHYMELEDQWDEDERDEEDVGPKPKRRRGHMPLQGVPTAERDPIDVYRDNERLFYINCRFTKDEFEELHSDLLPILSARVFMKQRSSSRRVLFLILEWLAHTVTFSQLVDKWGGSEATLSRMLHELLPPISEHLYHRHVHWLDDEEKAEQRYNFLGFPNAIAAVDCLRFPVPRGINKAEADAFYSIDKKILCLKVQVWCSWRGQVLHVLADPVTVKGRRHELTILRDSPVSEDVDGHFGGDYYGLGDCAYIGAFPPESPLVITPYPKNSPEFDAAFNKSLSSNRIIIENVFGHLMARWKRLFHNLWELGGSAKGDKRYDLLPECIRLAFALTQRLFERRGYPRSEEWLEGQRMAWEGEDVVRRYIDGDAGVAHDAIIEHFANALDEDE